MPQSLSKIYIHLVFSTKNREANILPQFREEMFSYIAGTLDSLGCATIIVGGTADHVHALFCMSRTRTVSDVARDVKANATKWYKERLRCAFGWQLGYGAFSVSQSKVETVRRYIASQEEHHRYKTFQEEYREFLESYGITYDERYVWD